MKNQPTKKTTQDFYDQYHQKNDRYFTVIGDGNFTYWYIQQMMNRYLPLFKTISTSKTNTKKNQTHLDVGCGVGTIALYLSSKGTKKSVGIDISPRAINIAKLAKKSLEKMNSENKNKFKNVEFKLEELKKTTKNSKQYDIVTCTEVIEHIPNDTDFLEKLLSNIKPGGHLLLSTPSKNNWLTKIGFYKKFDKEVGHLRRYDKKSLRKLVKEVEKTITEKAAKKPAVISKHFKILEIRPVESPLRSLLFTTKLGILIKLIRGPLISIFHWFDEIIGKIAGYSDLIMVVKVLKK